MIMKQIFITAALSAACILPASAKEQRPVIFVNADVTTHIVMPEQLKMVDISTNSIAGDQCADNMIRIKPVAPDSIGSADDCFSGGDFLGTITLIGERHMAQYDIIYDDESWRANALYNVKYDESVNYSNPNVAMPEAEMANYAWAIANTKRSFNRIKKSAYGISASVYNIYTIGDYFFIDLYLKNNTNIEYDIAQMRVSLSDKKETKATNNQTIELTPAYVLNNAPSFKKDYRQVIVLEKLTFPDEKVLNIEISEDQISGRVLTVPIEYEDILHADCFYDTKGDAYYKEARDNKSLVQENRRLTDELRKKQKDLNKANQDIKELDKKLKNAKTKYIKIERKLQAYMNLDSNLRKLKDELAKLESEIHIDYIDDTDLDLYPDNLATTDNK